MNGHCAPGAAAAKQRAGIAGLAWCAVVLVLCGGVGLPVVADAAPNRGGAGAPPARGGPPGNDVELCARALVAPDQSIPACTRLLTKAPDGPDASVQLENRGLAKMGRSEYRDAIEDFTNALNRSPNQVATYNSRGLAWQLLNEYDKAIDDFSRAIKLSPDSPGFYSARGSALHSKGEYSSAIQDFNRAIALDKNFAKAYVNRGIAFHYQRQLDKAVDDLTTYIKLKPKDINGFVNRAAVRLDNSDFDGAVKDYSEAIALSPQSALAFSGRGEAYRLKGDLDSALADHNKAVQMNASPETYVNRALVHVSRRDIEAALADCDKAILLDPRSLLALANRGFIRTLKGDLKEALADLNNAASLNANDPMVLTHRGNALREANRMDEAIADFDQALRVQIDFVAAYTGRGLTFEKKAEPARARADFERALKLSSAFEYALAKPAQDLAKQRIAALDDGGDVSAKREAAARLIAKDSVSSAPFPVVPVEPAAPPLRRVALVIGNGAYKNVSNLPNPSRDADAMTKLFRDAGFETVMTEKDVGIKAMRQALQDFSKVAATADVAVFFYAGHAIEVGGQNHLIPIDAALQNDTDVQYETMPLDLALDMLAPVKRLKFVILDACRNNPFVPKMKVTVAKRSVERGLARQNTRSPNTLIAFAAPAGETAADGDGQNSPFTSALLKRLTQPGIDLRIALGQVHDDVLEATKEAQEPFQYGALGGGPLFLGKTGR